MSKIMDLQGIKSSVIEIKDLKTWFPIQRGILSKTAGYVRAVDGISLTIGRGEDRRSGRRIRMWKVHFGKDYRGVGKSVEGYSFFPKDKIFLP